LFARLCSNGSVDLVWRDPFGPAGPGGAGGVVVTPGELAQVAYSRLQLPTPQVHFNPARATSAGPATTVNLPTWWVGGGLVDAVAADERRGGVGAGDGPAGEHAVETG